MTLLPFACMLFLRGLIVQDDMPVIARFSVTLRTVAAHAAA